MQRTAAEGGEHHGRGAEGAQGRHPRLEEQLAAASRTQADVVEVRDEAERLQADPRAEKPANGGGSGEPAGRKAGAAELANGDKFSGAGDLQ